MNESNQKGRKKLYSVQDFPIYVVNEPEEMYITKPGTSYDEDFDNALATAITGDELREYMYKVIRSWPWDKK